MLKFLLEHKLFAGILGAIILTFSGIWFIEARYANASEYEARNTQIQKIINEMQHELYEISKE